MSLSFIFNKLSVILNNEIGSLKFIIKDLKENINLLNYKIQHLEDIVCRIYNKNFETNNTSENDKNTKKLHFPISKNKDLLNQEKLSCDKLNVRNFIFLYIFLEYQRIEFGQ